MNQNQSSSPFIGIEVSPAEIEKALIKIWREAAQDDVAKEKSQASGEVSARVKATLANLIILEGDGPVRGMELEELITELCLSFPSRFCIVRYRSGSAGAELKTGVSSRCMLARSGAHVCSEELYIGTGPGSVQHVPNLVLSVLVPDTPVVVLMSCDPSEEKDPQFHQLLLSLRHLSDRIILDSRHIKNYGATAGELLSDTSSLIGKGSFGCSSGIGGVSTSDLRDLTWHRMGRWRSLVTELFDGDRADAPARIEKLRIESDIPQSDLASGTIPINALLLAGWFAAKLGWQIIHGRVDSTRAALVVDALSAAGKAISIEIASQAGGKGIRRICAIELKFGGASPGSLTGARIERDHVGQTVEVSTTLSAVTEVAAQSAKRLAPFASISGVAALTHELMSGHCDLDYLAALGPSRQIWNLFTAKSAGESRSKGGA